MTTPVWYIHGAHATAKSFAWLKRELPAHESVDYEYSTEDPMKVVLADLIDKTKDCGPIDLVGHSLGGVLAISLAQKIPNVRRIVTMSAPFGGCAFASMMRFMAPGTIMEDIHPYSRLMMGLSAPTVPVLSIVTRGGSSPMMAESNDGVVTVSSQKYLQGPFYVDRDVNHFEVLLDLNTARTISAFLWD